MFTKPSLSWFSQSVRRPVNRYRLTIKPLIAFSAGAAVLLVSACGQISLSGKPGQGGAGQGHGQQGQGQAGQQGSFQGPSVAGYWTLSYTMGNKKMTANARLTQNGQQFEGSGADDHNSGAFNIEQGRISSAGEVRFYKKYPGKGAPIEYNGTVRMVDAMGYKGPYMEGEYVTASNGKIFQGKWEAQLAGAPEPETPPPSQQEPQVQPTSAPSGPPPQVPPPQAVGQTAPPPEPPPEQPVDPGKPPHLSGKWNTGYVYHGKTIHSTMYLEQEEGKIKGHGTDANTKEKFTIKGWYAFPKVTLVRTYVKGKGAAMNKTLTFRAKVQMVNDADYHGPYLEGETTLGELWQAQQYR